MTRRNRTLLVGAVLALGVVLLVVTGCGGQRQRPDVAAMEKGAGVDFCDRYPQPVASPYVPLSDTLAGLPGEHARGASQPVVQFTLYGDLQCPPCAETVKSLDKLLEAYPDEVQVVFHHLPLVDVHDKAHLAAQATEAASGQGGSEAFWAMHDLLYERLEEWDPLSEEEFKEKLADYAGEIGLDEEQFARELEDGGYAGLIDFSLSTALEMPGMQGTPILYVNGQPLVLPPVDFISLDALFKLLRAQSVYSEAPPMKIDPEKEYVAWIVTEHGDVAVNLFADLAPETVNNFAYLACTGYYDDLTFHRVISGFVVQTGDPSATGYGGPGYTVPDEFENSKLAFDRPGWLSMAHTDQPDSAGGQFFITLGSAPQLNNAFTIFGEVADGMDAVYQIGEHDPENLYVPGDRLVTIIVREVE
jgi:cyclophilin family peptidyl-prolyl cis-trans isomerase/protein-disulfide isomerase